MDIYTQQQETVYTDVLCNTCDMPAAHKFNGTATHSHDFHPCSDCTATIVHVQTITSYDGSA